MPLVRRGCVSSVQGGSNGDGGTDALTAMAECTQSKELIDSQAAEG